MDPQHAPSLADAGRRLWTRREWLGASLAGLGAVGCSSEKSRRERVGRAGAIRILIWADYFTDFKETTDAAGKTVRYDQKEEVLSAFEELTEVKVDVTFCTTNDDIYRLLTAENADFDLAMPSAFMTKRLHAEGWLREFPLRKETRVGLIDKRFALSFDPKYRYSVPYIWGSTGIAYNAGTVEGLPRSWGDLFARQQADKAKLTMSLVDEGRFTLGSALIYLGYSPNTHDVEQIEEAGRFLITLRGRVGSLESEWTRHMLEDGTLDLAMAWGGDVTRAMRKNKRVRFALPEEGSIIFKDSFVLPRTPEEKRAYKGGKEAWSQRKENAVRFVEFVLQPEMAAKVTNFSCYATTIPAARAYVDRSITNGASYFINPSGHDFHMEDLGEDTREFDRVWSEVRGEWPDPPSLMARK